jgi:RimJ/RimL family protein N-acetyltransferase
MAAMDQPFAVKPTIEGHKVLLRPMVAGDAEALLVLMNDDESNRLTGTHRTFTLDELRAWAGSRGAEPDRLDLVIVDRTSGAAVGEVVINEWDAEDRACNFRIGIGPGGRDRGLGSEATRLVVDHVFTTTDAHRIGLEVFDFNPRAAHIYEKAGFRREGVRRDVLRWAGEYHSAIIMSILRPEWESASHEARRPIRPALNRSAAAARGRPAGGGTR